MLARLHLMTVVRGSGGERAKSENNHGITIEVYSTTDAALGNSVCAAWARINHAYAVGHSTPPQAVNAWLGSSLISLLEKHKKICTALITTVGDVYIRHDMYIQVCIVLVIVIVYRLYSPSRDWTALRAIGWGVVRYYSIGQDIVRLWAIGHDVVC